MSQALTTHLFEEPSPVPCDSLVEDDWMTLEERELFLRARSLIPVLAQRHAACEDGREVPAATIEDFRTSGILKILQPRRFGGFQGTPMLSSLIVEELTLGCTSSAWVYAVLSEHSWIISCFPERAQIDVWGDNPDAVASSSLAPRSLARGVKGGYRLSGQYPFSSGCAHAHWAIVGAFCQEEARPKHQRYMLVPLSEIQIVDDWHVLGLRGTGSRTLLLG